MNTKYELLNTFEYVPYIDGYPKFYLKLYDTGEFKDNKNRLAYEFFEDYELIFSGDNFFPSPAYAIDSEKCANALLGFLSLRPGDTDADYFMNYTNRQMSFCITHGEALSIFCYDE